MPVGCASRLIPGQSVLWRRDRKTPHAVSSDGSIRIANEDRDRWKLAHPSNFADAILPAPFAGNGWQLWSVLLADHVIMLITWMVVTLAELFFGMKFSAITFENGTVSTLLASSRLGFALLFTVIATLFGYSEGLYQRSAGLQEQRGTILVKSVGWTTLLLAVSAQLANFPAPTPAWLLLGAVLSLANLFAWRRWRERQRCLVSLAPEQSRNVLIVGAGQAGHEVANYLEQHREMGRIVRGFLDEGGRGFGVLGTPKDLAIVARAHFIDEIIVAIPQSTEAAQSLIREARRNHLDVKVVPDLFGCDATDASIESLGTVPLVTVHREILPSIQLSMKRALDVVISAISLLLATPVMLGVALLIRLDSPGPVIYAAQRVGRKGQRFRCLKFRTMVAQANAIKDELWNRNQRYGPCFKIDEDPRITRVGRWLRRYSLDELPQLWNVLRGEMSLVGPRPHPLDDFARYQLDHLRRLDVVPGITGLWQVMARRSPSFQTTLALDLEYIENWSLWMDLRILMRTVAVVIQGTGE